MNSSRNDLNLIELNDLNLPIFNAVYSRKYGRVKDNTFACNSQALFTRKNGWKNPLLQFTFLTEYFYG